MKALFISIVSSILLISNINIANASNTSISIEIKKVNTENIFAIAQDKITDGIMFDEMNYEMISGFDQMAESIWWSGYSGTITMDLGNAFMVQEILMQVESNDAYQMEYFISDNNWSTLFTVNREDGDTFGMDIMSSDSLNEEYVASMDFTAVETRYLRLSGLDSIDHVYYLSEIQVFGDISIQSALNAPQNISPVPAPPSVMLFGAGLMMLMGLQYRRKQQAGELLKA
ncbi:hypothetical protein MNBD_GAMMA04-2313 [hydrothermal vent metagenome]|uniref:F5/8 type C domain-containing protein n=1 Tax=hydrothermal vent metagenome TaxID=652676 RepID=A0A3B0VYH2_9ZZZZ